MTRNAHRFGQTAERHIRSKLEHLGYQTVTTNWRCQSGEIDLVMLDNETLVFVEVKARAGESAGSAEQAIDEAKAGRLLESGEWFLAEHPEHQDRIWRIDLYALTIDSKGKVIRETHVENAVVEG